MNTAKVTIGLLGLAFAVSFFFRTSRWFRFALGGLLGGVLTLIFYPGVAGCLLAFALSYFFFSFVSTALKEGEISVGWMGIGSTYYRDKNPAGYWFYVFFIFSFSVLAFGAAIYLILFHPIFHLSYDIIAA